MSEAADTATLPASIGGNQNLANLLVSAAADQPGSCALVYDGIEISYAELDRRSRAAAAYLQELGVGAGDHVGIQIPNCPAFAALYFGILSLGATVVPQNPLSGVTELNQNMADAGAKLVLAQPLSGDVPSGLEHGAEVVHVASDDGLDLFGGHVPIASVADVAADTTAVILYTSGTTGRAKGAELTHANLTLNAAAAIEIYSLVPGDVILGVLPLYHSYGQTCTLNGAIAVRARVVLAKRFEAGAIAELIDRHSVSVFLGVPTMFSDFAQLPPEAGSLRSLRLCGAGGATLPPEIRRQFEARSGAPLFETYGLSETSPIASINRHDEGRRVGTIGWPIAGTEMKIVASDGGTAPVGEIGEIAIRGHNIMKGYWRNPDATRDAIDADGWFFSGDLGTVDAQGCFSVVGRLKDVIIRGGANVYPAEIEHLLDTHPAVRLAAVVGVPDTRLGEEIGAAVMLRQGAELTPAQLRDWARERLSPQKYPRHVWIVEQLPLGPTGKVLKRLITAPDEVLGAATSRNTPHQARGERKP
ncbi:MAG TPA: AMP-binding protein [Solirubrobacteraceae bacterium]|jgi:long-chain acyl-CoA synthetase|nr:AMP-binding protein [Solirubrobacteraceae bacterium]